jgi:hypothetical protein
MADQLGLFAIDADGHLYEADLLDVLADTEPIATVANDFFDLRF